MNYEEFLEYVKNNLCDSYKEYMAFEEINRKEDCSNDIEQAKEKYNDCSVSVFKVLKNNGIELDACAIYIGNRKLSPNIYLKPYYDSYRMGKPLGIVLTDIVEQYIRCCDNKEFELKNLYDFKEIKNDIVIRLINLDCNKELLKDCPHKVFLDLAVVFRCVVNEDEVGLASVMITNREFEKWEIDLEDLYFIALYNTSNRYPWQMIPISKMVLDCFKNRMDELPDDVIEELNELKLNETGVNMFVLTNQSKLYGASCILYENVIKNFARVQDANIYILPSSVHEVMLVPEEEMTSPEFLRDLLSEANRSSVGLIDLLSYNIYYYDLKNDEITLYNGNC